MKSIHTRHRGTVAAAHTVRLRTFYIADCGIHTNFQKCFPFGVEEKLKMMLFIEPLFTAEVLKRLSWKVKKPCKPLVWKKEGEVVQMFMMIFACRSNS
jgi:hypothetical protein